MIVLNAVPCVPITIFPFTLSEIINNFNIQIKKICEIFLVMIAIRYWIIMDKYDLKVYILDLQTTFPQC